LGHGIEPRRARNSTPVIPMAVFGALVMIGLIVCGVLSG
jgi:hypothetical protein